MWSLDYAISELAAWIDLARFNLTDDDMAILGEIGGVLYWEGCAGAKTERDANLYL